MPTKTKVKAGSKQKDQEGRRGNTNDQANEVIPAELTFRSALKYATVPA